MSHKSEQKVTDKAVSHDRGEGEKTKQKDGICQSFSDGIISTKQGSVKNHHGDSKFVPGT